MILGAGWSFAVWWGMVTGYLIWSCRELSGWMLPLGVLGVVSALSITLMSIRRMISLQRLLCRQKKAPLLTPPVVLPRQRSRSWPPAPSPN